MQHAAPRPPAADVHGQRPRAAHVPRAAPAPRALVALALAASLVGAGACGGEQTPQTVDSPSPTQAGTDSGPQLATAGAEQLLADARAQSYSAHPGAGDEQMLSTIVSGQRRFGPLATISARGRLDRLTLDSLRRRGYAVARIVSSGPYEKLGIERDTNWLYVQLRGGPPTDSASWDARMVSQNGTSVPLTFNRFEDHPADPPPASARWLWVPNDEAIWVRCASGCCTIGRK